MITQKHVGAPRESMIMIRKWSRRKVVHVRLFGIMHILPSARRKRKTSLPPFEKVDVANNTNQLDNIHMLIEIALLHSSSLTISQCQ